MDLGSGRRGVDMGPSAIRIAGVADRLRELGHKVVDDGDIVIKNMEELKVGNERARYLAEIARASALLARKVERIMDRGHFPLVLGRRSLDRGGHRLGHRRVLPAPRQEARPAVDRRARRHQHPRDFTIGQHPRHAAGSAARLRGRRS